MNGRLFFALMYEDRDILKKTIEDLKKHYGKIISKSPEYNFNFTDYYEGEFGKNLKKTIVVFDKQINKKDLLDIKKIIPKIEKKYSFRKKRRINIDPGYFSKKSVVLVSFKKKDFKDQISRNIFLHKVLGFEKDEVVSFYHTFSDFKTDLVQTFFVKTIKQYL